MILKPGVSVRGLRPEMCVALQVAEPIFLGEGVALVVTSAVDGRHKRGSLHYVGLAVDLRTRDLATKKNRTRVHKKLRKALGDEYDVVLEKTHMHVEFDPKEPA